MDKISLDRLRKRFKMDLKEHFLMSEVTTFRVGGLVDFFLKVKRMDDLIDAVTLAQEIDLPYIVIGFGSNMIFSDYGFPGLVIKNETSNISFLADKSQVIVDSGLSAYILALQTANRDLSGLENIASATGSIGSVLYSNYTSSEINLVNELKKITVLNARSEILTYKGSWLFSSKSVRGRLKDAKKNNFSINPNNQEKLIKSNKDMVILTAIFQLRRSRQDDIMRKINELMPNKGKNIYPNTGNLFYDTTDESAARLILRSGAYRLKVGEIAVNPVNHNQLINKKSGQANEARQLIEDIKKVVFDKTNISLVEAIEFLGVW